MRPYRIVVLSLLLFLVQVYQSSFAVVTSGRLDYRTSFGRCPSRTAGALTLKLIKVFEENRSLKDVKRKIVDEKLAERHFISDYRIEYDPMRSIIKFDYNCPEALMRVQIYKDNGLNSYDAILVSNGQLYDPSYEEVMKAEKKLNYPLPFLALPVAKIDKKVQDQITKLINSMSISFRNKLSEVILNSENELTIIFSIKGNPSSAFLGVDQWGDKIAKLKRVIKHMDSRGEFPVVINLTNSNKVVVKFNKKI